MEKCYAAIDLKSFYASVECVERNMDPLNTNLVVADKSRTDKTICLAVSPSLKAWGIPGRPRLFEVVAQVGKLNEARRYKAPYRRFKGKSCIDSELKADRSLELDYIVAPPRMAHYIRYSSMIYQVYLKYAAPEDIHVYSIDEVFIDLTSYLATYKLTPHDLVMKIVRDVLDTTGITATAGIGTNLFLAKVAMDIVAKHMPADKDGVRIAQLDESSYRRLLWGHTPITDFWRVGRGYASKLASRGLYTMGDVARFSLSEFGEKVLYKVFGVNAELLIDHAWGWEPCTIADIKNYRPESNSLSSGQVLQQATDNDVAKLITWEMADMLSLDLVEKGLVTDQLVLHIGYDIANLKGEAVSYSGDIKTDRYGRRVPVHAHGTINLGEPTSSSKEIDEAIKELFDRITDPTLSIRRINVTATHVISEKKAYTDNEFIQLDFFTDLEDKCRQAEQKKISNEREKSLQQALLTIKHKYGKNAILKGANYRSGATARERNQQIGGHRA